MNDLLHTLKQKWQQKVYIYSNFATEKFDNGLLFVNCVEV